MHESRKRNKLSTLKYPGSFDLETIFLFSTKKTICTRPILNLTTGYILTPLKSTHYSVDMQFTSDPRVYQQQNGRICSSPASTTSDGKWSGLLCIGLWDSLNYGRKICNRLCCSWDCGLECTLVFSISSWSLDTDSGTCSRLNVIFVAKKTQGKCWNHKENTGNFALIGVWQPRIFQI